MEEDQRDLRFHQKYLNLCSKDERRSYRMTWGCVINDRIFGWTNSLTLRKGRDVWPSMATHTRNLCSTFNPSKCPHTAVSSEQTHSVVVCSLHTPGAVGLVPCSRVSHQSWFWGWREDWTFTPPTYNPCRTWDSNPQPLGDKSDSLPIRPRLPPLTNIDKD